MPLSNQEQAEIDAILFQAINNQNPNATLTSAQAQKLQDVAAKHKPFLNVLAMLAANLNQNPSNAFLAFDLAALTLKIPGMWYENQNEGARNKALAVVASRMHDVAASQPIKAFLTGNTVLSFFPFDKKPQGQIINALLQHGASAGNDAPLLLCQTSLKIAHRSPQDSARAIDLFWRFAPKDAKEDALQSADMVTEILLLSERNGERFLNTSAQNARDLFDKIGATMPHKIVLCAEKILADPRTSNLTIKNMAADSLLSNLDRMEQQQELTYGIVAHIVRDTLPETLAVRHEGKPLSEHLLQRLLHYAPFAPQYEALTVAADLMDAERYARKSEVLCADLADCWEASIKHGAKQHAKEAQTLALQALVTTENTSPLHHHANDTLWTLIEDRLQAAPAKAPSILKDAFDHFVAALEKFENGNPDLERFLNVKVPQALLNYAPKAPMSAFTFAATIVMTPAVSNQTRNKLISYMLDHADSAARVNNDQTIKTLESIVNDKDDVEKLLRRKIDKKIERLKASAARRRIPVRFNMPRP